MSVNLLKYFLNNVFFFSSSAKKCVLNILCYFFSDVKIPLVIHGLYFADFLLYEIVF